MQAKPAIAGVRQVAWSAEAGALLEQACDMYLTIDLLQLAVEHDRMGLFAVEDEAGEAVAFFVLRHDRGKHDEIVIVAAAGYMRGVSLFQLVAPYVEDIARTRGAYSVRGHVHSEAKARLACRVAGYERSEIIIRKTL